MIRMDALLEAKQEALLPILEYAKENEALSVGKIQQALKMGYATVFCCLEAMEKAGILDAQWQRLIPREELEAVIEEVRG